MEDLSSNIDRTKDIVTKDIVLSALMRCISKILLKNINSLGKTENDYYELLDRSDVKKLFKSGRTVINSDVNTIRGFFKDLEYIIFGAYEHYKKSKVSEKLDIATGGEDISKLEAE